MNTIIKNNGDESLKDEEITVEQFYEALLMCIWAPVNLLEEKNQNLLGLFNYKHEKHY